MSEPDPAAQNDQASPTDPDGIGAGALEPREWDKAWKRPFLEALAVTDNVTQACRAADVSTSMAHRERREHSDFAEAWAEAKLVFRDLLLAQATRVAMRGEPRRVVRTITKAVGGKVVETTTFVEERVDRSNAVLLRTLEAKWPEEWGRRLDHRVGGNPDGPPIQHELGPRQRTPERLLALLELARELGVGPGFEAGDVVEGRASRPSTNGRAAGELEPPAG